MFVATRGQSVSDPFAIIVGLWCLESRCPRIKSCVSLGHSDVVSMPGAIKFILTSDPVLRLPDPKKTFVLRTDASDYGIGAVLMQEHEGKLFPICYASRKLSDAERNYSTIEK